MWQKYACNCLKPSCFNSAFSINVTWCNKLVRHEAGFVHELQCIDLSPFSGHDELELGLARVELDQEEAAELGEGLGGSATVMDQAIEKLDDSLRLVQSGYLWRLSRSSKQAAVAAGGTTAGNQQQLPHQTRKWNRRFFVLRADACLYFFKTENVSSFFPFLWCRFLLAHKIVSRRQYFFFFVIP